MNELDATRASDGSRFCLRRAQNEQTELALVKSLRTGKCICRDARRHKATFGPGAHYISCTFDPVYTRE